MDHNFVSPYSAADDASSSSLDPLFSGFSLQSILSLHPSVFSDYAGGNGLPSLAFLSDDSLSLNIQGEATQGFSTYEDHFAETTEKKPTILPKSDSGLFEFVASSDSTTSHPFDFFSGHCPPSFYDSSTFNLLPQLHSVESFSRKRPRFDSLISTPNTVPAPPQHNPDPSTVFSNNLLANTKPASSSLDVPPVGEKSSPVIPQSNLARQRRQKLSDKTRCLQKLMPWDKKMDQATLLEEAYKYVKFLQAQFNVLQSMPSYSPFLSHSGASHSQSSVQKGNVFGDLERLNRNQVLQVLVNSPVAQTRLYSQGFCVFTVEQLTLLNNMTGKRLLLPQIMSDSASSKSFFK